MCTVYKKDTHGVLNRTPSLFGDTALLASSGGSQVFPYPILTDGMAGYVGLNGRSPRINPHTDFIVLAGSSTSYTKYSDCTKKTRKLGYLAQRVLQDVISLNYTSTHAQK